MTLAGVCAVERGSRSLIGMAGDSGSLTEWREEENERGGEGLPSAPATSLTSAYTTEGASRRSAPVTEQRNEQNERAGGGEPGACARPR